MSQISTKLLESFSNDFAQLLESEYDYNVIVNVREQKFKLHSLVLYQRSSFFRQKLLNSTKRNNIIEILLPDISIETFKILIKFIYTGTIQLEKIEPSTIFGLLIPSNKLDLKELVEYIQSYLIDNKASWLRLKFTQVYSTSFQSDNFKKLQAFCTDIIVKHPNLIFDSDEFTSIQENALKALLKRDDLQIEESEIWDKVIQWGKAQTPDLPYELEQWSNEDFLILKTTLKDCVPLIRYFQMPGKDLVTKVKPYRQILGSTLWEDITTKIMDPDMPISSNILPARKKIPVQLPARKNIPDQPPVHKSSFINPSTIINEEHFAEISSWINRQPSTYGVTKIPYKFKLILRGSRDGFSCESFHRLCDNIPGTISVMKVKDTNEILGGYNPLVWSSNNSLKWFATTDSFIFSLKSQNLPNSILSRIIHSENVIGCSLKHGPVFGVSFYMNFSNNKMKWSYNHHNEHYERKIRDVNSGILIDEFEVFQVIKTNLKSF